MPFETVLDIGCGDGQHAKAFEAAGKHVTLVDLEQPPRSVGVAQFACDYLNLNVEPFDCIWACHVLEHQRNVGTFLDKCYHDLAEDGILAITVPPAKPQIVGGHLTCWNAGLLLYNLILAGFDCAKALVKTYDYNISVIVRKKATRRLPKLRMDSGDIETLSAFFPVSAFQGFNGEIMECNW